MFEGGEVVVVAALGGDVVVLQGEEADAVNVEGGAEQVVAEDTRSAGTGCPCYNGLIIREKLAFRGVGDGGHGAKTGGKPAFNFVYATAWTLHARIEQFRVPGIERDNCHDVVFIERAYPLIDQFALPFNEILRYFVCPQCAFLYSYVKRITLDGISNTQRY